MSEDRKWRPDRWSKETILRRICKARRQIMRLARRDEQIDPGTRDALACMDASENAVDSIECAAIAETLKRAAGRIVMIRLDSRPESKCRTKRSANTAGARKRIRAGGAAG